MYQSRNRFLRETVDKEVTMDETVYKTIKLLLIEDNLGDVKLIKDQLNESDKITFEVIHTKRLSEGIVFLEEIGFDVVLLDLGLPDSKGIETFNKVRNKFKDTPIVILTGSIMERDAIRKCIDGAERYLVKGYTNSESLISSICEAIDEQNTRKLIDFRMGYART